MHARHCIHWREARGWARLGVEGVELQDVRRIEEGSCRKVHHIFAVEGALRVLREGWKIGGGEDDGERTSVRRQALTPTGSLESVVMAHKRRVARQGGCFAGRRRWEGRTGSRPVPPGDRFEAKAVRIAVRR